MKQIADPLILKLNPGLEEEITGFLNQQKYIGISDPLSKKIANAVFDPIFTGVKAFGNAAIQMPDQMFKMGLEINKAAFNVIRTATSTKPPALDYRRVAVSASLDLEVDDASLPLRVLILLVDEFFGLQSRNQWFRARIISTLRQFLHITYGQSLNRKIINFVRWLTSEPQLTMYLSTFRLVTSHWICLISFQRRTSFQKILCKSRAKASNARPTKQDLGTLSPFGIDSCTIKVCVWIQCDHCCSKQRL